MGFSSYSFNFMNFLVLLSLFHHLALAHLQQPFCHDNERSALLQFKQSLVIDPAASYESSAHPKAASWEENSDCCLWDGIKCDEDTGHVIKLDLSSSWLFGSINSSSSLFQLVHLEWLDLQDNHFNFSKIPSGINSLSRLSYLDLSSSGFTGQIPSEILELSNLKSLDLSHNKLELYNPSLSNLAEKLKNLKLLDLSWAKISSIPPALTNLSSLASLHLEYCRLKGEFLTEIFQLPNLQVLSLKDNPDLTGYLPEFNKSNSLKDLRLSYTGFSGNVPDSIENLPSLSFLDIGGCYFSGIVSPSLGNLPKLEHLYLFDNEFSGELPASIGNLGSLKTLAISSCNFSDEVQASLGNLTHLSSLTIFGTTFSCLDSYSLSWIANLNQLTYLELSYSNLGEIPSILMNLTQLTELYMSHNYQLAGPIPNWLMKLNKLSFLHLNLNKLSDHIPVEIRNLTQLQSLDFSSNQLEGFVPGSISQLKNLHTLDLSSNNLSGTVDLNMFLNLESLRVLVLSSNKLSLLSGTTLNTYLQKFLVIGFSSCNLREFPHILYNQNELMSLDLSSNKIAGQVPGWFLNVSSNGLKYLNLSYNLLTGFERNPLVLPWNRLATLDLRFNKLQGQLPIPKASIHSYLVSNNQLIGKIPPRICSLNGLHILDLSHNNFSGKLPKCLGYFSYELAVLKLQGNNFHGSIPQTFMNGTNLMMIDLSNNLLQGEVPKSLANCEKLKFLNLGDNQITELFPSWLGTLPELEVLVLKSNNFHGEIVEPKAGFEFPKLRIIDLSHNKFIGSLPSKYFECWNAMTDANATELTYLQDIEVPYASPVFTNYGAFDYSLTLNNKGTELAYKKLSNLITAIIFSNNCFVGEIPTSIANLKGLRNLNLSNNNLEGQIPSYLSNLKALESLDLSDNKLSGNIPQQLTELSSLAVFDVSQNNLTGAIPQGKQFNTFESGSYDENPGLCGEPLSKKCENPEASLEEDQYSESLFAFGWKPVVIGSASGTIIGVILGHIFSKRKFEWLAKTFRLQRESNGRRRKRRSQRM